MIKPHIRMIPVRNGEPMWAAYRSRTSKRPWLICRSRDRLFSVLKRNRDLTRLCNPVQRYQENSWRHL